MVQYLAAFRNEKGHPPVAQLFSDDEEGAIRAFVERHDRPGFAVYSCVSPLKEGSTRRSLETVAWIEQLAVDIDFKDIEESPDGIETKLLHLPLQPTTVRSSGGGLHLVFTLKEAIEAGSPEFAEACALLRLLTRWPPRRRRAARRRGTGRRQPAGTPATGSCSAEATR